MYRRVGAYFFILFVAAVFIAGNISNLVHDAFLSCLRMMVTSEDEFQKESAYDVIYVLGGAQSSLRKKYIKLGSICREIKCDKVLIPDRTGITAFNREMGRNLTDNEWSLMQLERFGVEKEKVELISTGNEYFGTLSEARAVTELMSDRKYRRALLITAPHHTARVKRSFSKMQSNESNTCYVTGSEEEAGIRELLMENLKLMFYTLILLPLQG